MTLAIIADIEEALAKLKAEFSPAAQADIKAVENAGHTIVTDAVTYIQANGLQDLEQLAIVAVTALAPGASWATMLLNLRKQAENDGKTLIQGAEGVVAAKVQADLIAIGTIASPTSAA